MVAVDNINMKHWCVTPLDASSCWYQYCCWSNDVAVRKKRKCLANRYYSFAYSHSVSKKFHTFSLAFCMAKLHDVNTTKEARKLKKRLAARQYFLHVNVFNAFNLIFYWSVCNSYLCNSHTRLVRTNSGWVKEESSRKVRLFVVVQNASKILGHTIG